MKLHVATSITYAALVVAKNVIPLKLDFNVYRGSKEDHSVDYKPHFVKRSGTNGSISIEIHNQKTFYMSTIEAGSQGDKVSLIVDTGSSDIWVPSSDVQCYLTPAMRRKRDLNKHDIISEIYGVSQDAKARDEHKLAPSNTCTQYGSFTTAGSDTFHVNSSAQQFTVEYSDSTRAVGFWGYDDVKIGQVTINNLLFAVANQSSCAIGVLGLGYPSLETTRINSILGYEYQNLPMKLKDYGLIQKKAYSLYLNSPQYQTGSVLFGAVDHAKYEGQLQTVPIVGVDSGYYPDPNRFIIILSGIIIENYGESTTVTTNLYPVLLDSGSTLSYFPQSLIDQLGKAMGGVYSKASRAYNIPCSSDPNVRINFNFSGAVISVPYGNFLIQSAGLCYLAVFPLNPDYMVLGDNFLTSAYVVYDLENDTISLAQAKYTDEEDIEIISDSIPRASTAPGYSSTSYMTSYDLSNPRATAKIMSGSITSTDPQSTATNSNEPKLSLASSINKFPTISLAMWLGAISIVALL